MAPSDNLAANISKVAYTNFFPTDKVIFSMTTTITVSATANAQTEIPVPLNGQLAFPVGIYSLDGGSTWSDFGRYLGTYNSIVIQTMGADIEVDPVKNVARIGTYVTTPPGGSTMDAKIAFALLAADTNTVPIDIPSVSTTANKLASTSISPIEEPMRYRNIIKSAYLPNTATSGTPLSIPHGLATVPDIAQWYVWFPPNAPLINTSGGSYQDDGINPISGAGVFSDATNLYWWQPGFYPDDYYYRMYKS